MRVRVTPEDQYQLALAATSLTLSRLLAVAVPSVVSVKPERQVSSTHTIRRHEAASSGALTAQLGQLSLQISFARVG